jgi:hypothetical protein
MSNDEYVTMPDENDLKKIARLGQEFVLVNMNILQIKKELEVAEKRFRDISEVELPDAMKSVNLAEFKLTNGYRIVIEDVFNVRLPKNKMDEADEWLDNNGHGGMIKRVLQVDVDKEIPEDVLEKLKIEIEEQGYSYEEIKTVHWATIQSWANEMKTEGELIPEDIFTVYRGNRTVITE